MPKYFVTLLVMVFCCHCSAQNFTILIREDTTLLSAENSDWIIKSKDLSYRANSINNDKSIPLLLVEAITRGNLKAFDIMTNKPIPSNEFLIWNRPKDSKMISNKSGNGYKMVTVQQKLDIEKISKIRICTVWYINTINGKMYSKIKWAELLEDVYTSSGVNIGVKGLCRIYY